MKGEMEGKCKIAGAVIAAVLVSSVFAVIVPAALGKVVSVPVSTKQPWTANEGDKAFIDLSEAGTYTVLIGQTLNFSETGHTIIGVTPDDIEGKAYGTTSYNYDTESWFTVEGIYHVEGTNVNLSVTKPIFEIDVEEAFAAYSDTGASQQPTVAKASEYVKAGADILVIETGYDVENSVCNVLDELGYTYDFYDWDIWDVPPSINYSQYDVVIQASDGGMVLGTNMDELASFVAGGGKLIYLGGSSLSNVVSDIDTYLLDVDTTNYYWTTVTGTPHLQVVNPTHPLAAGLPASYNFSDVSATYYMLRITDATATVIAENGDGYPALVTENIGSGVLIWFINSPAEDYWTWASDYSILKTIIRNALEYGVAAEPEVSVSTNTWEYSPGDIMIVSYDITNPTDSALTLNIYVGIPQFRFWREISTLSIPPGYDGTYNMSILVGNWGGAPFALVWYAQLHSGADIEATDATTCIYSPSTLAKATNMPLTNVISDLGFTEISAT